MCLSQGGHLACEPEHWTTTYPPSLYQRSRHTQAQNLGGSSRAPEWGPTLLTPTPGGKQAAEAWQCLSVLKLGGCQPKVKSYGLRRDRKLGFLHICVSPTHYVI